MPFTTKTIITLTCGGCNGKVENAEPHKAYTCPNCGGLIGILTRLEALDHIDLNGDWIDMHMQDARYFDFDLVTPFVKPLNVHKRIHGWFDPATKRVTQFG